MRRLAALLLLFAAAALAAAAQSPAPPPPSAPMYAVVSMVGDRLLVLNRAMRTGSLIERRNDRTLVDLHDATLNDTLGDDVYDALEPRLPGARVVLMPVREPAAWKAQNNLLERGGTTQDLVDAMKPFIDGLPPVTTYVVLASKMRSDALFEVDRSRGGSGQAEGLGFYVDRYKAVEREGEAEPVYGFLAAFAYFKLSLIDVRTRKVVREVPVVGSLARTAQHSGSDHPWDAMSAAEKVEALKKVMRDEAPRAVEKLLAGGDERAALLKR